MEMSCGALEITGVSTNSPENVLKSYVNNIDPSLLEEIETEVNGRYAFRPEFRSCLCVFSDVAGRTAEYSGTKFANYLRKHKLGTVRESAAKRNPNSQNMIKVWIWEVNKKNTLKHLRKIGALRATNDS